MMQTTDLAPAAGRMPAMSFLMSEASAPGVPPPEHLVRVRRVERAAWLAGGVALAALGMTSRVGAVRVSLAVLGGLGVYRAARGTFPFSRRTSSPRQKEAKGRVVQASAQVTIDASPAEVYQAWRRFERLPKLMTHLEEVSTDPSGITTWVLRTPLKTQVSWRSKTLEDRPGEVIAWESLPDSDIANQGFVRFDAAPGGRGTELRVGIGYVPPAGKVGKALLKLVGQDPEKLLADELRRFKQLTEAGEITTVDGQTSGRKSERSAA